MNRAQIPLPQRDRHLYKFHAMLKRRFILENLTRETLLDLAYAFDIPGLSGKRNADIISIPSRKRTLESEVILRR